jgi:hypothetical protein
MPASGFPAYERTEPAECGSWEGTRYYGTCDCGKDYSFTEYRDTTPSCFDWDRPENHTLLCSSCRKELGTYSSC